MYAYIAISALYRLACGALIIAINWLMVTRNESPSWLAITVALTFIPAMIVPLIWKNNSAKWSGLRLTQISLLAVAIITAIMSLSQNQYLLLTLNTIIWFFFFVMESSWESWFVSECNGLDEHRIQHFSSLSMSLNQAALMIGPILAAYIFSSQAYSVIIGCAVLYAVCFVWTWIRNKETGRTIETSAPETDVAPRLNEFKISGIEIALLLVWPTLATFNFMLPAQVRAAHGDMTQVGLLDALMGLGMIASGVLVGNKAVNEWFSKYRLSLVLLAVAMGIWAVGDSLYTRLAAVFLLGVAFNSQRILIRGQMARKYHPDLVGKIVSTANAFSFILIAGSLAVVYDNVALNWMVPFVFSFVMGASLMFMRNTAPALRSKS